MKSKILFFIIGFLVGAIVATGGFLIYQNVNKNNKFDMMDNFKGERQEKMFDEQMQAPQDKPLDNEQNSTENNTKQDNANKKQKSSSNEKTSTI